MGLKEAKVGGREAGRKGGREERREGCVARSLKLG